MSEVRIPTTLRPLAEGRTHVQIPEGIETIAAVITWLETECPGIEPVLLDTSGETPELNRFVNIYVGPKGGSTADDIRFLGGLAARVQGDDEVTIIPAIAGGCSDTDSGVSRHIPGEEQRARADALEQRVRDGDPTLTTYILADLEEQFGVTR